MDQTPTITYVVFLIFAGTAVLSTIALFTRQSLLVAYIALGALMGPWGLQLVSNSQIIHQAGDIGIIFLLFLLGLDLQPQNLFHSLRKMSLITLSSSLAFFIAGFLVSYFFGYNFTESLIIGCAALFSSTIIGIELLPTAILHHQHTGELVISILLLQDIIAIAVLLGLEIIANRAGSFHQLGLIISSFPILIFVAYVFQQYILTWLLRKFDQIHEYIFILSIGWCLCMAELSHYMGLSEEIGAFIGGVALASNPIASYIAESLKPLRDFFLVIFFFSIGATFSFGYLDHVFLAACLLAGFVLIMKPAVFNWLLQQAGETAAVSKEIGVRLGQMSEFSLLVVYMALDTNVMGAQAAYMAEAAIIITFIVSCYWTVMRYPTPLAATANSGETDMSGNHHDHHHHSPRQYNLAFAIATVLALGFTLAEAIYGYLANSMSLMADAAHNLGDGLGLILAWVANWLLTFPPRRRYSYGYKRTTIMAALINAAILVGTSFLIAYESIYKLFNLTSINEKLVIIVAAIGIVINGGSALLFRQGMHSDLNIRGAFWHLFADMLVSVGVVIAAIAILYTGWLWLDPVVGLVIVLIVLWGTWGLMRDALRLMMDAVPQYIDYAGVKQFLTDLPGVEKLHDLHIWGLSTREVALTAHLVMPQGQLTDANHREINDVLHERFHINHVTLQVETGSIDADCAGRESC